MISKILLNNFKSFSHFGIDLCSNRSDMVAKNLIMIYGENGIGKTSIVDSIKFLSDSFYSIVRLKSFDIALKKFNGDISDIKKDLSIIFNSSDLIQLTQNYMRIDSNSSMRLCFEFVIKKRKYIYDSLYNLSGIVEEKLLFEDEQIFCASKRGLSFGLNNRFLRNPDFVSIIHRYYSFYFGKHSVLSCINQAAREINEKALKSAVSTELALFMQEIEQMFIESNPGLLDYPRIIFSHKPSFKNILSDLFAGNYNDSLSAKIENSKAALSRFYTSLYSNIVGVDYEIVEDESSNNRRYSLVFLEKNADSVVRIPYTKESTGTKKLVSIFGYLYQVCISSSIVVIDEIDNGINDILLKKIIDSIVDSIKGQLIFTTHNTLLLSFANKNNIYVLDRRNGVILSYPLSVFGRKIQSGTDVVKQYIKGLYGGAPSSKVFSMKDIIDLIN